MAIELKIPEVGESITEVQIGEWRKSEGEHVQRDEVIVEIETDKASMELPAPSDGVLSQIKAQPGDTVSVGDVIAIIGDSQKKESEKEQKPAQKTEVRKDEPEESKEEDASQEEEAEAEAQDDGKEKKKEKESQEEPKSSRATKDDGRDAKRDIPSDIEVKPRVMPDARQALAEYELDSSDVQGTGPGGRILREDVLRSAHQGAEAHQRVSSRREALEETPLDEREERVPMSTLRRRIAQRLVDAQQTAALLTTFNEVDMSAFIQLRKEYGDAFLERFGVRLGFMSIFVKASIEALKRVPEVNAEIRDKSIIYKNYYDIGVAVATDEGLVVPVLRDADRMSFADIERAIADLAGRARERKLTLKELSGGTFTISNGGVYGSLLSTPIVNPPQSGILGLHTIQDRPIARDKQVVIRPMMYLALTYDHRIVDGKEAVLFLKHIRDIVQDPARMLIEI